MWCVGRGSFSDGLECRAEEPAPMQKLPCIPEVIGEGEKDREVRETER
jgi:hypothetical protein